MIDLADMESRCHIAVGNVATKQQTTTGSHHLLLLYILRCTMVSTPSTSHQPPHQPPLHTAVTTTNVATRHHTTPTFPNDKTEHHGSQTMVTMHERNWTTMMSGGEAHLPPAIISPTWKPGATSLSATWQPNDEHIHHSLLRILVCHSKYLIPTLTPLISLTQNPPTQPAT